MARILKRTAIAIFALVALFACYVVYRLIPSADPRPLPQGLVSAESDAGEVLLRSAVAIADYDELAANYEPQKLTSFCGVASSVVALNSMGGRVTQTNLFNAQASQVRPIWEVAIKGMTIDILAHILEANGARVKLHRAGAANLNAFRSTVARNLTSEGDYLLVNYQRQVLGQDAVGHISPLAAYDARSDRVLVMDTAAYKYPPTWVPIAVLYRAMQVVDPETGKSRGWVEVKANPDRNK